MFKKLISLVLATIIAMSFSIPAFATEVSRSNLDAVLNPDEETMYNQMLKQLPSDEEYLLQEGIIEKAHLVL